MGLTNPPTGALRDSSIDNTKQGYNASLAESVIEALGEPSVFEREQADRAAKTVQVISESTGVDASIVMAGMRAMSGASASISAELKNEEETKKRTQEAIFIAMMNELDNRIRAISSEIDEIRDTLIDMYGKDFVFVMGDRYLDPEIMERHLGETDEDYAQRIEQALADEMLNEDGSIKAEYEGVKIAEFLAKKHELEVLEEVRENAPEEFQRLQEEEGLTAAEAAQRIMEQSQGGLQALLEVKDNSDQLEGVSSAVGELRQEESYVTAADQSSLFAASAFR